MILSKEEIEKADFFLDWFNNFLTIECFAEYNGLSNAETIRRLEIGKELHQARATETVTE